jgi:hypothetical protein
MPFEDFEKERASDTLRQEIRAVLAGISPQKLATFQAVHRDHLGQGSEGDAAWRVEEHLLLVRRYREQGWSLTSLASSWALPESYFLALERLYLEEKTKQDSKGR